MMPVQIKSFMYVNPHASQSLTIHNPEKFSVPKSDLWCPDVIDLEVRVAILG